MPSQKIATYNNNGIYFLTVTVKNWYFIFDRHNRWQTLSDALNYAVQNRNLLVYGYVFMLNHIHLIIDSPDVISFSRDFKKHTSKKLRDNLLAVEPDVYKLFLNDSDKFHLWQNTNMPLLIETEKFLLQKLEYIHNNPVKKQYVERPEYWFWSSANPNSQIPISSWIS